MVLRHPASWPIRWLMTDERQGDALWHAVAALPRGSAVVLRHHRTATRQRAAMLVRLGRIARRADLILYEEVLRSNAPPVLVLRQRRGSNRERLAVGPRRSLGNGLGKDKLTTFWIARVHNQPAAIAARRAGAVAIMISPVFATRTHPGMPALGAIRAAQIAQAAHLPAIALGGMTAHRFNRMRRLGFIGWAAIDGLTPPDQKRKAVPI